MSTVAQTGIFGKPICYVPKVEANNGSGPSPLTMSVKERNSRWARWRRRYPNVAAWCKAHSGEGAGGLIGPAEIHYFRPRLAWKDGRKVVSEDWRTGPVPTHRAEDEIPEAEWREIMGLPPRYPLSHVPTWPSFAEKWRGKPKPVNVYPVEQVKALMHKLGVTVADLQGSNGEVKPIEKANGRPAGRMSELDAGRTTWQRISGRWYKVPA